MRVELVVGSGGGGGAGGVREVRVGPGRLPLGVGMAGTVAVTGETINVLDAYADARFHANIDQRSGFRSRSVLALPMNGRDGRVLGVFQLLNKRSGPFTAEDAEVISLLKESAAVAIENAQWPDH